MKRVKIAAIVLVVVLLIAGSIVVLGMNNPSGGGNGNNNNGNSTTVPSDAIDSVNKTLNVSFPVNIAADQAKMKLSVNYPGKGQEGTYGYVLNQSNKFVLVGSPVGGYKGNVLVKLFAEKSGEIDDLSLIVVDPNGGLVNWTFDKKNGAYDLYNVISGDIVAWKCNGTETNKTFDLAFNSTGNFTITLQAFDLDTGNAISEPLTITPLYVPVTGSLLVKVLGPGEWRTDENGTFRVLLINITNNWNIRYEVTATNLVLSNDTVEIVANTTAMTFKEQSLAVGQTTQFLAYFDLTGDPSTFELQYRDAISGQVYEAISV